MAEGRQGNLPPSAAGAGNPTPTPAVPPAANPFAAMMQQMMGNPAQMQQGAGTNPAAAAQPGNPMAANPFAAMMQQMQQGGANPAAAPQANPMAANPFAAMMQQAQGQQDGADLENNPMRQQVLRVRFSQQLQQLMAMGFSNEIVCLRVLAQHNGRVDAAMDALLSMGDACS